MADIRGRGGGRPPIILYFQKYGEDSLVVVYVLAYTLAFMRG